MKKRVLSLLSCALILATCLYPRPAHAVAPAIAAAAPGAIALLGDLILSCGVVFKVVDASDAAQEVLNMTYEELRSQDRMALGVAYDAGRWVIDTATGAYKYVVDVSDELWQSVKGVVDSLFDAGENVLTADSSLEAPNDGALFTLFDLNAGTGSFPITFIYDYSTIPGVRVDFVRDSVTGYISKHTFYYPPSYNTEVIASDNITKVLYYFDSLNGRGVFEFYSGQTLKQTRFFNQARSVSVPSVVAVGTVYGDSTAIDVPTYDWNNKNNNKKSFVFRPAVPAFSIPAAGASSIVDASSIPQNLIGLTAADLALQDVSGVDVATDTIADAMTEDIGTVIKSALASVFIPDEATLKSFQATVTEKLPIIPDLQNWGKDLLAILNNPAQFSNRFTLDINLGSGGGGKYGHDVINALPTSGYLPYKPLVDDCIVGFVWLVFLWNLYGELPSIIHGGSSALQSTAGIQKLVREDEDD